MQQVQQMRAAQRWQVVKLARFVQSLQMSQAPEARWIAGSNMAAGEFSFASSQVIHHAGHQPRLILHPLGMVATQKM